MSEPLVLREHDGGIAIITLNRPNKMNALSSALRVELTDALLAAEADDDTGVVILTGAGKAFCAGLDLKELSGESTTDTPLSSAVTSGAMTDALTNLTKPVIGAINGVAVTGGFELALACDLLIASTGAKFADTHARVGILPGWGLSQRLSRTIGIYRAKELSLTGNYLSAEQAERWGLVSRVVEPEALLDTARALAKDMLSCDQPTLRALKRVIDDGFALDFKSGMAIEQERCQAHAKLVTGEAVRARREQVAARGRSQQ